MKNEKTYTRLYGVVMTIILILLSLLIFSSCNFELKEKPEPDTVSEQIEIKQLGTSVEQYDRYYQIYTLEGCEYIVVSPGSSHYTWGTHKGNCKNPIHNKTK